MKTVFKKLFHKRTIISLVIVIVLASITGYFGAQFYIDKFMIEVQAVTESEDRVRDDIDKVLRENSGKSPSEIAPKDNFIIAEHYLNKQTSVKKITSGTVTASGIKQGLYAEKIFDGSEYYSMKISSGLVSLATRLYYKSGAETVDYFNGTDIKDTTATFPAEPTKVHDGSALSAASPYPSPSSAVTMPIATPIAVSCMSISPKSLEKKRSSKTAAAVRKMLVHSLFMRAPPFQQQRRCGQGIGEQREEKPKSLGKQRLQFEERIVEKDSERQQQNIDGGGREHRFTPERFTKTVYAHLCGHAQAEDHHERDGKDEQVIYPPQRGEGGRIFGDLRYGVLLADGDIRKHAVKHGEEQKHRRAADRIRGDDLDGCALFIFEMTEKEEQKGRLRIPVGGKQASAQHLPRGSAL